MWHQTENVTSLVCHSRYVQERTVGIGVLGHIPALIAVLKNYLILLQFVLGNEVSTFAVRYGHAQDLPSFKQTGEWCCVVDNLDMNVLTYELQILVSQKSTG
jgi:hypothetical protein